MPVSKKRGKVACKVCNLRRIRCDRTDETPCSNCQLAGHDCQPIVSKRGKHKRDHFDDLKFKPAFCSLSPSEHAQGSTPSFESGTTSAHNSGVELQSSGPDDKGATNEGAASEERLARATGDSSRQPHPHVFQRQDGKAIYYGDAYNFDYVLREMGDASLGNSLLCGDMNDLQLDQLGSQTKRHVEQHRQKEHARLKEMGAFNTFEKSITDELIRSCFTLFYPAAPAFDRADFCHKYETGRLSPLVLQAVYSIAFSHCSESLYKRAGFENRYLATYTCHQRAKALYDASYETDAIATIQGAFLLANWWCSPMEPKDSWYWMGVAVNLAQSMGLHQEKTYRGMGDGQRRSWRRIWWTLYVHDIYTAVVLGRTPHINDAYCSTGRLTEEDFQEDDTFHDSDLVGELTKEGQLYSVHMVELCLQVSNCCLLMFGARADEETLLQSLEKLSTWGKSLPRELQLRSTLSLDDGFWAALLQLTYRAFQVLLYRNGFSNPDRMAVRTIVFGAAADIVRILENMLTYEVIEFSPLSILPPAFSALSVQIANMRGPPLDVIEVSKHRARLCMVVVNKLYDYWPPLLGYYPLFVRILASLDCQIPAREGNKSRQSEPSGRDLVSDDQTSISAAGGHDSNLGDLLSFDPTTTGQDFFGMASMFPFSSFLQSHDSGSLSRDMEPLEEHFLDPSVL